LTEFAQTGVPIDPITFEVLANAFTAVVDDMGAMMEKVSFSTVTQIGKDYACVLATPAGDVFARGAGGLPLLTGTADARIKAVLRYIPANDIDDGDAFLINDPFMGGTHGQDVGAVMPVFADAELLCYVMSASHWPDMGGPVAGSFNSEADSTHGESLLIPPIHIIREGLWDAEIERMILRNVRIPSILRGDLRGMIEACRTGRDHYLRLHAKYGGELLSAQMHALMDHSEQLLRQAIRVLPNGTYSFTDWIDRDPGAGADDPIAVGLDLTIDGDRLIVDFSRSGPQAVGPVNGSASATRAAATAALKAIFFEVPWNEGFERAIEFVLPPRSVVNAEYPRPVSGVAASPAEKVLASVHGCMVQVVPERSMACPTNLVNVSVDGHDYRDGHGGEQYVMYIWLAGGWGGRPGRKDAHTSVFPIGPGTNLQPVETLERVYPIRFEAFELKPDSEGAGRHRGGFALECPWRVTHGDATINVQGDRQRRPGWGVDGGQSPQGTDLIYAPGTVEERRIDIMSANNRIREGVRLDYRQSGGGGWQDPFTRPSEWVLRDVRNELVSLERAREVYGVVITPTADPIDALVDEAATRILRSRGRNT
jgi:N-methylhydantoinase B